MKNQKLNFISLKKTSNLNKAILPLKKKPTLMQNSKEEGPFYLQPISDINISSTAYQKPNSILTKYITYHAQKLIKTTEENIKKPSFLENIEKKIMLENKKYKNGIQSINKTISAIINNDIDKSKEKEIKKNNKFYLTAQESNDISSKSKMKTTPNEYSNKMTKEQYYNWNNEINLFDKFLNGENFTIGDGGIRRKHESSMSLDRQLNKDKFRLLNNTFHRLRTYQPKIEENWKSTHGLTINIGAMVSHSKMDGEIEYQYKSLNDQFKLLIDNINYYKMNIINKENYIESFKCLSLRNKINYNKSLEELCGLLLLLPQLILLEFYKYIEKFDNLNIPDKNKFKDKYIFDEVSCLYYNNNLLSEVAEYFQNCFEVYLILVKEVDDMSLKPKNFTNSISAFEKARFDISYACNLAENAMANYNKDINIINKLNRLDNKNNKFNNSGKIDKLRNNISLNKNTDRQRRLRIDACINNKEDKNKKSDIMLFTKTNKLHNKKKFNSIIDSDLMTKILKNCKKDIKYEIITQRINNELDESYSEEGEKIKKSYNIIKLNKLKPAHKGYC